MEVFLHKICGQPVQPPVSMQLRRCTPEQAPAVYALQNEVRAAMPDPEQFVPDTLENITAYVRKDLCIGDGRQPPWRVSHRALLRAQRTQLCGLHGCAAHRVGALGQCGQRHRPRRLRGNGLQRLMLEAALPLFPKKITHIGATVSPQNQYSLHNALASGFAIVSRREMYGGHDRYLLAKEL